jgi:hypothetical protein
MFNRDCLWRHKECRSIAFEVKSRYFHKEKGLWKLTVQWYKIGTNHPPQMMMLRQAIKIPDEKAKEWKRMGLYSESKVPTSYMVTFDEQGRIQNTPIGQSETLAK